MNVFMRAPINPEVMNEMKKSINKQIQSLKEELSVKFLETKQQLDMALQQQQILPERHQLELKRAQEEMEVEIESTRVELEGKMMAETTKVDNVVVPEEQFKIMQQEKTFNEMLVDSVKFYKEQIRLTCVAGDKLLYEKIFQKV